MFGINYNGLRKKKTYDELIDYVMNKQEKIQYPDRTAEFLRNNPQLSNLLDGEGEGLLEMEEQQKRQIVEVEKDYRLREMAGPSTGSGAEIRSASIKRVRARYPSGRFNTTPPIGPEEYAMDVDDDNELNLIYNVDVDAAINKQEENVANKKSKILENAAQDLSHNVPQMVHFFGHHRYHRHRPLHHHLQRLARHHHHQRFKI